jgi:peroxiredoxin
MADGEPIGSGADRAIQAPRIQPSHRGRLNGLVGLAPFALAVLGVAIAAYFVLRPQGDTTPLSVAAPIPGHPAPTFLLRDIDGVPRSFAAQRGRAVLLNFWGVYCLPCRHEMPQIQRAARHFAGQPVTIWGIEDQSDPADVIRLFINQIGVSYPQLPDPHLTVGLRYRVNAIPVSVFICPDGRVSFVNVGALQYPDFVAHLTAALRGR